MTSSPWTVQHGKPIEACSLGRINYSREQTLYLIKRANQGQINFNKLQAQTTEWVYVNVLLLQTLLTLQRKKAYLPDYSNASTAAHVNGNSLSGANTRTLWMSVLWCSWHYRWPTVVKTTQMRDYNEISIVSGHSKKGGRALLALMLLCIM